MKKIKVKFTFEEEEEVLEYEFKDNVTEKKILKEIMFDLTNWVFNKSNANYFIID